MVLKFPDCHIRKITRLDALVQGHAVLGDLILEVVVHFLGEALGHPVVVLREVWEVGALTRRDPVCRIHLCL